ncbi:MAG: Rieske 2Fe-2S domain-containing protein [Proteobacteria bacterium]|nr:Rieske 2Fe-2S domain-containing protein [Pseudomonadota bacterium]MDA1328886.1 Rieske 2Fe-2S domain-containing protein [Pseudomonadota bacterium]
MKISFKPDNISTEISTDESILTAALRNGINHLHACGGSARCSTCRIQVVSGLENCNPRNELELKLADTHNFSDDVRLACQTTITGNVDIRRLLVDIEDLKFSTLNHKKLGPIGSHRKVAILFADIQGFTPMSERMQSYDVMYVLNKYFDFAGKIINANGGEINNYIGDAFLAIFGLDDAGDEVFRAIKSGLEIQDNLITFAKTIEVNFNEEFKVRIGIHYGDTIIGMLGSRGTERLSVIGDTVNMAARVEAANKESDTFMLVSETAYQEVRDRVEVHDYIRVKLKGTSERSSLYEISKVIGDTNALKNLKTRVLEGTVWHRSFKSAEVLDKDKKVIQLFDKDLLIFRFGGELKVVQNNCPHMNLPLDAGQITDNGTILCPFHDSEFCIHTGEVKRWVENLPPMIPEKLAELMKVIKPVPIQLFQAQEIDGYIWISEPT